MYVTLTPAYGRDYKSAKAVKADWLADKDFIIANIMSQWDGKPINRSQAVDTDDHYSIRYAKLAKIVNVS